LNVWVVTYTLNEYEGDRDQFVGVARLQKRAIKLAKDDMVYRVLGDFAVKIFRRPGRICYLVDDGINDRHWVVKREKLY